MLGSAYGYGWPSTGPVQPTPWGIPQYPLGGQGIGLTSPLTSPVQQQVVQLLQSVTLQLQNLQQLTYHQQQQLQQIQQLLYFLPQQVQQALQQIAYLISHQQFQHPAALQSSAHATGPFGITPSTAGLPFQGPSFGQQAFPAQPGHLM